MKTNRELKVDYIATIIVCGKPMQLSCRETKNDTKCYLHFPLRKVTVKDEISKDLCLTLIGLIKDGKNN